MSPQLIVSLVEEAGRSATSLTVLFWPDGRRYEFPLSATQATALRAATEPFITAARQADSRRHRTTRHGPARTPDPQRTQAIRSWAHANGHLVAHSGPIPKSVLRAYESHLADT